MPTGFPDFPTTDQQALERFEATRNADPFPAIPPALLNTADLLDYIAATGMIFPFSPDPDRKEELLKPASCAIPVAGEWLYWPPSSESDDPQGTSGVLARDAELWLQPNSIVYVTLEPYFRIPNYIAARYNLRIKHIYRGILVGTGPLVDPGFTGRLSVPLHNLTANAYRIKGGEPLVWMEFTKLTPNREWTRPDPGLQRKGEYVAFPPHKLDRETLRDYVQHGYEGPIRSSIPEQIEKAKDAAEAANRTVGRFRNVSYIGALATVLAVVALVLQAVSFVDGARDDEDELRNDLRAAEAAASKHAKALRLCAPPGAEFVRTKCLRREVPEP